MKVQKPIGALTTLLARLVFRLRAAQAYRLAALRCQPDRHELDNSGFVMAVKVATWPPEG
jgi:hypothetical protein